MLKTDVQMILCDVDGTLLPKGERALSKETLSAIQSATESGIRFVVASGRAYQDLRTLFAPSKTELLFVASDGGVAVSGEAVLYSSPIPKEALRRLTTAAQTSEDVAYVAYAKDYAYCKNITPAASFQKTVSDFSELPDNIYKVAFYRLSDFAKQKIRIYAKRSFVFKEIYCDDGWTEFVLSDTDKGNACRALQKQFGISPSETVAFGDNTNDYGMLRQAGITYASPQAISDIARMCKYKTDNITNEIIKLTQERGTL